MENHPYVILEEVIKEQYKKDRYDPSMYEAIFKLSEKIVLFRQMADTRSAIDEIAHECSKTIWTRIKKGTEIDSWTKYIMLELKSSARNYRCMQAVEVLEIDDPVELEDYVEREYYPRLRSEIQDHYILSFLGSVSDTTLKVVKSLAHYSDVIHIRNLYLTVLSRLRGRSEMMVGLESTISNELYVSYVTSEVFSILSEEYRDLVKSSTAEVDLMSIMIDELSER